MPEERTPKQQFAELIRQANSILILTHAHPDGDALGSLLALKLGLEKLDKDVTCAVSGNVPEMYAFLPSFSSLDREFTATKDILVLIDESQAQVGNVSLKRVSETKLMVVITPKEGTLSTSSLRIEDGSFRADLVIVLDCSDLERMGELYVQNPSLFFEVPVINIDHHVTNTNFGTINLVDLTASSTAEILVSLLETIGKDTPNMIDADIATCLLTGIATDTGSFQNANTTPKSLTVAAQMVAAGGRQQEIVKHVFMTRSLSQLRLWGRALSYIKEDAQHKFAWSVLTKADFVAAQADTVDASGVVDELLKSAEGVDFVILLYERDGGIKASLRAAQSHIDVSGIAQLFGGGGHTQAAAFFQENASIAENEQEIIKKVRDYLSGNKPPAPEAPALVLPEETPAPRPKPRKVQPKRPEELA